MVSMAVAGLLAASRFPFAMSRDNLLPPAIRQINSYWHTPVNSILLTAAAMAASILFLPIEQIAKLASAFMILAFIFVCGTVIVLRENAALWYRPRFRSPLYPWLQIVGIMIGIVLLGATGWTGFAAILGIVLPGMTAWYLYGRKHAVQRGEIAKMGFRSDLVAMGKRAIDPPLSDALVVTSLEDELPTRASVVVPLFGNERSPETLVEMGAAIAHGQRVEVLRITAVPEQIQLADALADDEADVALSRRLDAMAEAEGLDLDFINTASRDVVKTVFSVADRVHCEWVVIEDTGQRDFAITSQNQLGWLNDHLPAKLAVFKDAGIRYIRQILVYAEPGPHDALVVNTADHLAQVYDADLNFVCFLADGGDPNENQARADYVDQLGELCVSRNRVVILNGKNELAAIQTKSAGYDLLVMGAPAGDRTIRGRLFGSPKDNLTRRANCSVLWLKTPRSQSHQSFNLELRGRTGFDLLHYVPAGLTHARMELKSKDTLFRFASRQFAEHLPDLNADTLNKAFWDREQMQNTGVGKGVALPHATLSSASDLESAVAVITASEPIDYDVSRGEKVDVFFFTIGAPGERQTHLGILAAIARLTLDAEFMEQLRAAPSGQDIQALLRTTMQSGWS